MLAQFGLTGLDDAIFRYETEPYQACRDRPSFSLVRCGNRRNRFTRPELGMQPVVLIGTPRKAMPERRPIGIVAVHLSLLLVRRHSMATRTSFGMFVRPLVRHRSWLLRQQAFDQSLPFAIGQ